MQSKPIISCLLLLAFTEANAQSTADLVRKALETSPTVAAHRQSLRESELLLRSTSSAKSLELDLSPGTGFTNSNFVLGQSFDLNGTRSAAARRSKAEVKRSTAKLKAAEIDAARHVLRAAAEFELAAGLLKLAKESLDSANSLVTLTKKRVEIGEAPAVHATRTELEALRAQQFVIAAESRLASAKLRLDQLSGQAVAPETLALDWTAVSQVTAETAVNVDSLPGMMEALALVEVAAADESGVRAVKRPSLFAGIAADIWSLDRDPFERRNMGFQVRLAMPIVDFGENSFAIRAASAAKKSREAELEATRRNLTVETEIAKRQLSAAQASVAAFSQGMLPRSKEMLEAMTQGLQSGLTTLIDVLEARRAMIEVATSAISAVHELRRAEIEMAALAHRLPGLEVR